MKSTVSIMLLLSFFSSCSAQKKICIETFNNSKRQEKIFSTANDRIYYLFPSYGSKEDVGKTYLDGLNNMLKHNNKPEIPGTSELVIERLDSINLPIFEKFFSDKPIDNNKTFLVRVYSNNKDLIFEGILLKEKKFCRYLQQLSSSERKIIGLGPASGNIKLPSDKKIRKLISTYFVLVYRNQSFEYNTLN